MSVSVEQPLLFSQQPSPPSFSSPPHSPTHLQHAHAHAQPLPSLPPADMDRATSTAALAHAGQSHDRGDADMQDGEVLANEDMVLNDNHARSPDTSNSIAVQVAPIDEDAMDTAPDTDQELVLPNSPPNVPLDISASIPAPAVLDGSAQNEPGNNDQAPPEPLPQDATQAQAQDSTPVDIPPPADPSLQPPPPPPPIEPVRSDSDSSDDEDDGLQPWHPIHEDKSSPDEDELKEIEALSEHSALDHEYWESKAFLPLEEPEYTAGEIGRIEWTIEAYNGTREKPNREIVMKSEPVTIGGHQWQIKFYPKGNDSDYLSVYLECLSVKDKSPVRDIKKDVEDDGKAPEETSQKDSNKHDEKVINEHLTKDVASSTTPTDFQHTPLPLLDSKTMPKRNCVAAQVSVVMYNPIEPRVNYTRTALHRFCNGSPDWGWTRFHGPYYDIPHRMRGQRQALLRDDKIAFTGYIRIVNDKTNCLWEHHSRDNPWDSFAMTGLQSLMLGEDASAPGGNMISAVVSWMLFKPFRDMLYSIKAPNPEAEPFTRPKPLLSALQKVLYMLRTQVDPGAGAVTLDDVLYALEWYGIYGRLDKLDVVEVWEVLRARLEQELHNTPQATIFEALCGTKRDYSSGIPTYRVPVVGVGSMQQAINMSPDFLAPGQTIPQLLSIELDRQFFDVKTRSYVKVMNKVTLDDHITVCGVQYTLYGFVVHKQTLQSYVYQPILRPQGPGTKWYSYSDSKDENQVKCLAKRQAVDAHEGTAATERVIGNEPVAYIAMYVCDDMTEPAFHPDVNSEPWDVPEWIRKEVEKAKAVNTPPPLTPMPPMPPPPSDELVSQANKVDSSRKTGDDEPTELHSYQVIDSRVFVEHEGPGFFNAYDSKWQANTTGLISAVQLKNSDGCEEIREKLAAVLKDIKDPRQVKFWFLDPNEGSLGRPNLIGTGKIEFSSGSCDRHNTEKEWNLQSSPNTYRRIWVHIIEVDKIPELPKEEEKSPESIEGHQDLTSSSHAQADANAPEPGTVVPLSEPPMQAEDTPMSEPDEPELAQPEQQASEIAAPGLVDNTENLDTAMVEVESASVPDPPTVDVVVPAFGDTEMSGTQESLSPLPPPPPPPPVNHPIEPTQLPPPPPERIPSPAPPADEIYFFLKFFDPEKQTLESRGSHLILKSARVDETVAKLFGLPLEDKKKLEMWEEEGLGTTRLIKHRRTFAQVDLHNSAIVIIALPQTPDQRSTIATRAAFSDIQPFLASRAFARNFPWKMNGHFTYNYFSSQYYKGEIKNGHRHGHGYRVYHSGATYEGTFRLGQHHGHGLYTFQNGDTYDGDWVDNQQHGSGTFVEAATGNTYVGGWKNDKKFGEGVTHWKNAQEAERLCRICWEDAADAAFYDCGHVVACLQCAREVQNCPVCRKRVLSAMKLYYVA